MERGCNSVCWTAPSELIDCSARQYEGSAGVCGEFERLAARGDFIPNRALEHDVQEIMQMLVPREYTRRHGVILKHYPRPARGGARQLGLSMQQQLDSSFAPHFDTGQIHMVRRSA